MGSGKEVGAIESLRILSQSCRNSLEQKIS